MPVLIFVVLFWLGCASAPPMLSPIPSVPPSFESELIQVTIKPVITKGIHSEDEDKWGVDISAYFTAFEVKVVNHTLEEISYDPSLSRLVNEKGQSRQALSEDQSIRYYENGDAEAVITLVPKPRGMADAEMQKIKVARIPSGKISPGGRKEGLLLFKKVRAEECDKLNLELNGITVVESGEVKAFSFPFTCNEKG